MIYGLCGRGLVARPAWIEYIRLMGGVLCLVMRRERGVKQGESLAFPSGDVLPVWAGLVARLTRVEDRRSGGGVLFLIMRSVHRVSRG